MYYVITEIVTDDSEDYGGARVEVLAIDTAYNCRGGVIRLHSVHESKDIANHVCGLVDIALDESGDGSTVEYPDLRDKFFVWSHGFTEAPADWRYRLSEGKMRFQSERGECLVIHGVEDEEDRAEEIHDAAPRMVEALLPNENEAAPNPKPRQAMTWMVAGEA